MADEAWEKELQVLRANDGEHTDGRKFVIPLENNPSVFTPLTSKLLGTESGFAFHDVFSFDPEILSFIPRPAVALIVLIPSEVYWRRRARDVRISPYAGFGASEPVIWYKQTIGDACGLIALLHALSNTPAQHLAKHDSLFASLFAQAIDSDPARRAKILYDSAELEAAHMSVAVTGDSTTPALRDPNYHHFIAFTKGKDGHVWELEGGWAGPIDRGELEGEDVLSEKALDATMKPYLDVADGDCGDDTNYGKLDVFYDTMERLTSTVLAGNRKT